MREEKVADKKSKEISIIEEFPAVGFLFFLFVLITIGFFLYLGLSRPEISVYTFVDENQNPLLKVFKQLKTYFSFADDWNWLIVTVLISLSVVLLAINEIFIRRIFFDKEFYKKLSDKFQWLIRISLSMVLIGFEFIIVCYVINISVSAPHIINLSDIRNDRKYTLMVLGTRKVLPSGNINVYYKERIIRAKQVLSEVNIDKVILSGDRKGPHYDETRDMLNDLKSHINKNATVLLDTTGYRTFDSILKLKGIDTDLIMISQSFHLERALYIARIKGLNAIGIAADGTMNLKMVERELLAKTKALLDIYVFNTQSFGVDVYRRRSINISKSTDIIILLAVISCVALAGRMSVEIFSY